jgi:hypothetical protein
MSRSLRSSGRVHAEHQALLEDGDTQRVGAELAVDQAEVVVL